VFREMKLRDKTEGVDAVDRTMALLYDAPEVEIRPEGKERQLREMKSDTVVNCRTCADNSEPGCKTKPFDLAWVCQQSGFRDWKKGEKIG